MGVFGGALSTAAMVMAPPYLFDTMYVSVRINARPAKHVWLSQQVTDRAG
jgi:hypothetical protein